ncbi:MAG TPA: arylsulfatase [Gemmatimonadaceae bacterium]|nr:arylsulfatase [Gemmatimonadaceae bacterium]
MTDLSHQVNDALQRDILPIPDVTPVGATTFDAKDPETKYRPIVPLRPPTGAPNVLIVLIDDAGFGAASAFGGPIATPSFERLAAGGLKYNRFHTTALCSPTRAALLCGRNHHTVGMGSITELATSAPGQNSIRPNTCAPLAEILKLNGYSTAQFGKCHEVPVWETSPLGPFEHWPSGGGGFEYFYGFIGGETNQYYPALYEGTTPVEPSKTPEQGYHLTTDLTDKAIKWVRQQKSLVPDKPFFMYFAPGATHAPHHVPKEWSDRYKGKFDQGWDALREETFKRQKELGVIPNDCQLTPRHTAIPAWDTITPEMKPVLAREMEVYAGFLEHVDHHVGLLVDALADLDVLNDTLIYVIIGDNGASAEGSLQGTFNEMITLSGFGALETPEFLREHLDKFGGPEAYNHYAVGWAHAMDTPYQWTKQISSHWGGTRNGTIVHWPHGIKAKGAIRSQFHHVIDVAPTVLEVAHLSQPTTVNGVLQKPIEGVSMVYSFDDAKAAERHDTQYFEMFGNRGIYHRGWTAVTKHRTPWETGTIKTVPFDADCWELYDTNTDWSQAKDLAKEQPEKLAELQRLWLIEAVKYNVLPLDDRMAERGNSDVAGRPTLVKGDRQLLFGGMGRLTESSILNLHNKSYAVTADIVVPKEGADGVIIALGGITGGWSLYAKGGTLKHCYNFFGLEQYYAESKSTLPEGRHQVRLEFAYDGGGPAKGGELTLYVDGKPVGEGRIEQTEPALFSADETCDIGTEYGSPVTTDYSRIDFTGTVNWVELAFGDDAKEAGHYMKPEERLHLAMAVQ